MTGNTVVTLRTVIGSGDARVDDDPGVLIGVIHNIENLSDNRSVTRRDERVLDRGIELGRPTGATRSVSFQTRPPTDLDLTTRWVRWAVSTSALAGCPSAKNRWSRSA